MAIRGFCISAPEAPARRNAAGVVSLPATERLQLRFDCGALDPGPQKPLPNDPRDCTGLCAPSHHRRKPITAARLLSAQCRKRNFGLKLWPQVSQLRACDEVAQQLRTQGWNKRWSAGAAEQYLDGRVTITRQVVSSIQIREVKHAISPILGRASWTAKTLRNGGGRRIVRFDPPSRYDCRKPRVDRVGIAQF